jgi:hypothetical protein
MPALADMQSVTRSTPSSLPFAPLVAVVASSLVAQVQPTQPGQPGYYPTPQTQVQMPYYGGGAFFNMEGQRSIWTDRVNAPLQGFPTFPSSLGGYGGFPPPPGLLTPPALGENLPAPIPVQPQPPDWPSWVRLRTSAPLPYQPDRALLVRSSDRVWFRTPSEDAFVPLYFFDTARTLEPGSEVRVQKSGEFLLHLYDGGTVISLGPAELKLGRLEESQVGLEFARFTNLLLRCGACAHEFALPDGSLLQVPQVAPETGNAAELRLGRLDEPGWISGRAYIYNSGSVEVTWQTPFGDVALKPGEEVRFFLDPPRSPLPAGLRTDTVTERVDRRLRCQAQREGQVTWSGVRFRLPAGAVLELDPLLGRPFAQQPPAR